MVLRLRAFAVLLLVHAAHIAVAGANTVISETFQQEISHDPSVPSPGTFSQRYFLSNPTANMKPGSPLILYIGAETETGAWAAQEGIFEPTTWALDAGGLMLAVEHRYFGESLPFGKNSYKPENLKYLTIENALADCIQILEHVLEQAPHGSHPVMAFGGSYGGMLAAAIRLHYPHHVNASLASAAPVYLFGEVANSTWFDEVSETLLSYNNDVETDKHDCGVNVQAEFAAVWGMLETPDQWDELQTRFGLCEPIINAAEFYQLMFWAKEAFSEIVQFSYPRAQAPCDVANALDVVCGASVADRMRLATNLIYNSTQPWGNPVSCFHLPTSESATAAAFRRHLSLAMRRGRNMAVPQSRPASRRLSSTTIEWIPWSYICCTEFVLPVAGTGIFSVPAPYDLAATRQYCNSTFGVFPDPFWYKDFLSAPLANISATNIVFSNGGYDPVRGFSPATSLSSSLVAIDIPKMAHTFDLFATQKGDPKQVVQAREKEWNILMEMLHL